MFPEDIADIIHKNWSYTHQYEKFSYFCIGPHNDINLDSLGRVSSKYGYVEITNVMREDERVRVPSLFRTACFYNQITIVHQLMKDPKIDAETKTYAFENVCHNPHTEVVALLLTDPTINPGYNMNSPIKWAHGKGQHHLVELIIKDGRIDVSEYEQWVNRFYS